ncbi:MAG: DUF2993 domain-containing protein [Cyanobacteria bacterium SBLK]|nr:DUF2993 domain-containing protein [Cyanobacteria bacterium SBLK]
MEIAVIILHGLLSLIAPAGFALDTAIESNIRRRFVDAEVIDVRIDNTPTHQLLNGKVDRLRVATRGIEPVEGLRIAVFELETDPLNLDIHRLQTDTANFRRAFRQPVQGAMRLVLTEEDLNRTLSSPRFASRLQQAVERISANIPGAGQQNYKLEDLAIDFLEDDRLQLQVNLSGTDTETGEITRLKVQIETGLVASNGYYLELIEPEILLDDRPLPPIVADIVSNALGERLDLQGLQTDGMTLRLLQLEIERDRLELAAFVRLEPEILPTAPEE